MRRKKERSKQGQTNKAKQHSTPKAVTFPHVYTFDCLYLLYYVHMQDYSEYIKPHSLKAESSGRPVVVCPLLLYTDDTSGNRSKKWNKFDCWCMLLAGLPRNENSKLHNIHLITCSNKVSVLHMAMPMVDELLKLESGVVLYDAMLQQEVVVLAPVLAVLSDNPRHSELLNHHGGRARKFCRMCMVGNIRLLFHNYI